MNTFSYLHDGDGPICDTSPVERSHAHSTGNNGAQSAHLATSFEFAGTTLTHQLVQGIQKSKKWRRGRKLSENHVNFKDSMCEWRPVWYNRRHIEDTRHQCCCSLSAFHPPNVGYTPTAYDSNRSFWFWGQTWWTHLVVPLQRQGWTQAATGSSSSLAKQTQHWRSSSPPTPFLCCSTIPLFS